MRIFLPWIALSGWLLVSGCDIFLDDFGAASMPCKDDGDCQDGLECYRDACVWVDEESGWLDDSDIDDQFRAIDFSFDGVQGVLLAVSSSEANKDGFIVPNLHVVSKDQDGLDVSYFTEVIGDATGHETVVNSMAFLYETYEMVIADSDGIWQWDILSSPKVKSELDRNLNKVFTSWDGSWHLYANAMSGDFKVAPGDAVADCSGSHEHAINDADFLTQTYPVKFLTAGKQGLRMWTYDNTGGDGDAIPEATFLENDLWSISARKDEQNPLIAAMDDAREVRIFLPGDPIDLKKVFACDEPGTQYSTMAFSPHADTKWLLAIGREDGDIEIWNTGDLDDIYLTFMLRDLDSEVFDIDFSPDGRFMAASAVGQFVVYDLAQITADDDQ
jgi:WD40 repeat protein